MLVKDGKSKSILTAVGSGMIATATVDLLKSFGVLSGAEDEFLQVDLSGTEDVLAGDDISVINGNGVLAEDDISIINGDDDENQAPWPQNNQGFADAGKDSSEKTTVT